MPDNSAPLGEEIDTLFAIREQIRLREEETKGLQQVYEQKQTQLLARLKEEGIEAARGTRATAGVKTAIVPQVENWEEFYRYVHRNKAYHLLERRPSATAYRELIEQRKKPLPGVVSFTRQTLNLRTL